MEQFIFSNNLSLNYLLYNLKDNNSKRILKLEKKITEYRLIDCQQKFLKKLI
jgi:hypothetical protein